MLQLEQLDPSLAADRPKIAEIECQHRIYADIGVIKNRVEHSIYETHSMALRLGPCKHVFVHTVAIRGII